MKTGVTHIGPTLPPFDGSPISSFPERGKSLDEVLYGAKTFFVVNHLKYNIPARRQGPYHGDKSPRIKLPASSAGIYAPVRHTVNS
jgi:hypothetical protein